MMKKKFLLAAVAVFAVALCGCSSLPFVSKSEYESVSAECDAYRDTYYDALDEQTSYEAQISELEQRVSDLHAENEEIREEIEEALASQYTLEDYYNDHPKLINAANQTIENYKKEYADKFSDIGWTIQGNTVTYWYQFKSPVSNPEESVENYRQNMNQEALGKTLSEMEKTTGISGIHFKYVYYNSDGSLMGTIEYPN